MKISPTEHRYLDSESGNTIDAWFPRNSKKLKRSCLAEKTGIIKSDFVKVEIESLDLPRLSSWGPNDGNPLRWRQASQSVREVLLGKMLILEYLLVMNVLLRQAEAPHRCFERYAPSLTGSFSCLN